MVQMFTQEQLMPPSPLGQALGIGLEGAVSSFNKARETTKSADSLENLGIAMGYDAETSKGFRDFASQPEMAKIAFSALSNQQKAGSTVITSDTADKLSEATGGKIPASSFAGKTENEAKMILRAQEVSPDSEETKLKLHSANDFIKNVKADGLAASSELSSFAAQRAAVETGEVSSVLSFLATKFDIPQLESPELAVFQSGQQQLYRKVGGIFPKLNEREFNALVSTLLKPGQPKETQLAALSFFELVGQSIVDVMNETNRLEEEGVGLLKIESAIRKFKQETTAKLDESIRNLGKQFGTKDEKKKAKASIKADLFGKKK